MWGIANQDRALLRWKHQCNAESGNHSPEKRIRIRLWHVRATRDPPVPVVPSYDDHRRSGILQSKCKTTQTLGWRQACIATVWILAFKFACWLKCQGIIGNWNILLQDLSRTYMYHLRILLPPLFCSAGRCSRLSSHSVYTTCRFAPRMDMYVCVIPVVADTSSMEMLDCRVHDLELPALIPNDIYSVPIIWLVSFPVSLKIYPESNSAALGVCISNQAQ